MKIQPAVKWSGSKRSQSEHIVALFPEEIETYYEPFLGGASVLFQTMVSNKNIKKFRVSDINEDLIELWRAIQNNFSVIHKGYEKLWIELNKDGDIERRKNFYYSVRKRFNLEKSSVDFMFLMRTAVKGMPRYNSSGEFNTSLHFTRGGIQPDKLKNILADWNRLLSERDVAFESCSYDSVVSKEGDLLYLDPPYANTKGMYYGAINYDNLWLWLRSQKGKYLLSFDGKTTSTDSTYDVPTDIYKNHVYIYAGNSPFRRITKSSNSEYVSESLYKNY